MGDDDLVVDGDTSGSSSDEDDGATSTSGSESTGRPAGVTSDESTSGESSESTGDSPRSSGSTGAVCEFVEVPWDSAETTTCTAACESVGLECVDLCGVPEQGPLGAFCECC